MELKQEANILSFHTRRYIVPKRFVLIDLARSVHSSSLFIENLARKSILAS